MKELSPRSNFEVFGKDRGVGASRGERPGRSPRDPGSQQRVKRGKAWWSTQALEIVAVLRCGTPRAHAGLDAPAVVHGEGLLISAALALRLVSVPPFTGLILLSRPLGTV